MHTVGRMLSQARALHLVRLPTAVLISGLSINTLHRAHERGEIEMVKVGGGSFVRTASLLDWLQRLPKVSAPSKIPKRQQKGTPAQRRGRKEV